MNILKIIQSKKLNQKQLSKSLFPLGSFLKSEIRQIAKKLNLVTAEKKDSQGLCFVGKVKLPDFLKQRLIPKKGHVIKIDSQCKSLKIDVSGKKLEEELDLLSNPFSFSPKDGHIIGDLNGAYYFTTGQRKGLNIGGFSKPLFVLQTDIFKNIVYVGMGESHPALYRRALFVRNNDIHWVREDLKIKYLSLIHI